MRSNTAFEIATAFGLRWTFFSYAEKRLSTQRYTHIMKKAAHTFAATLLLLFSQAIYASKEAPLGFDSFYFSSKGIGGSGQVTVKGSQTSKGIQTLTINAFDKEYVISKPHLANLGIISANQIHISYEYGYYGPGGRTLYVRLTRGGVGGGASGKTLKLRADGTVRISNFTNE